MTNPRKLEMTDDIGRDLNPALGPEQVLLRFEAALEPIEYADDTASHYRVPIEIADAAADLIRQQAAQLAEAQAGGWISVQERLPEIGAPILVWNEDEKMCREATYEPWDDNDYRFCGRSYSDVLAVAFWQPLPALPAQKASDE